MTPTALVDLAEAKELMNRQQFAFALEKLRILSISYPQDLEVYGLLMACNAELLKISLAQANSNATKTPPAIMTVMIRDNGCLSLTLFMVIVLAILTAWFLIFFVFGFTLKIRPGLIQELLLV
jgi:hypothetical protein